MISIHPNINKIKTYYATKGWVKESVFLNNIIVDMEVNGGQESFIEWMRTGSTLYLRDIMKPYEKFSKVNKEFFPIAHFNNVHALDSAIGYIGLSK